MRRIDRRAFATAAILMSLWAGRAHALATGLGCCGDISAFGFHICADTVSDDCEAPATFVLNQVCNGTTGQCSSLIPPFLRVFDRKSLDPQFQLFDGKVVQEALRGQKVYRRIGVCNNTSNTLNYHTVWTGGDEPEFENLNFALAAGACTSTAPIEAVAEETVLKISRWCASTDPIPSFQCRKPSSDAQQGGGAQLPETLQGVALSILAVQGAAAPALGWLGLATLAAALGAFGVWTMRRKRADASSGTLGGIR